MQTTQPPSAAAARAVHRRPPWDWPRVTLYTRVISRSSRRLRRPQCSTCRFGKKHRRSLQLVQSVSSPACSQTANCRKFIMGKEFSNPEVESDADLGARRIVNMCCCCVCVWWWWCVSGFQRGTTATQKRRRRKDACVELDFFLSNLRTFVFFLFTALSS